MGGVFGGDTRGGHATVSTGARPVGSGSPLRDAVSQWLTGGGMAQAYSARLGQQEAARDYDRHNAGGILGGGFGGYGPSDEHAGRDHPDIGGTTNHAGVGGEASTGVRNRSSDEMNFDANGDPYIGSTDDEHGPRTGNYWGDDLPNMRPEGNDADTNTWNPFRPRPGQYNWMGTIHHGDPAAPPDDGGDAGGGSPPHMGGFGKIAGSDGPDREGDDDEDDHDARVVAAILKKREKPAVTGVTDTSAPTAHSALADAVRGWLTGGGMMSAYGSRIGQQEAARDYDRHNAGALFGHEDTNPRPDLPGGRPDYEPRNNPGGPDDGDFYSDPHHPRFGDIPDDTLSGSGGPDDFSNRRPWWEQILNYPEINNPPPSGGDEHPYLGKLHRRF